MNTPTRSMIALTAVAGLALTACGGNWSAADIEEELQTELDTEFPEYAPHELDCPGDLEYEVGESITCDLTDAHGDTTMELEIVDEVGDEYEYEYRVMDDTNSE